MLSLLKADSLTDLRDRDFRQEVLAHSEGWRCWERAASKGCQQGVEIECRAADNERIVLKGDIRPIAVRSDSTRVLLGVFTDVTAVTQLHHTVERTSRLEAVGSLTSGIAHDVNNLLTVLVGNLYLVAESVRSDPALFEKVKRARNAAKRGADLTRQLLSFARGGEMQPTAVDPGKLVANLQPLLERAIGRKISLETNIHPEVAPIDANAAQVESAIVNLVINARDALVGDGRDGRIRIEVANAHSDGSGRADCGAPPGEYVRISVADNGPGIPTALHDRVFEPFFSTKGHDQGTGLGLSMVRWLCERAGGSVTLTSRPGKGTTVSVLLPCSASTSADTMSKTAPLSALPSGSEKVLLLVEDEEIHSMVHQILETLGYNVHASSDYAASLKLIRSGSVDLVLTDDTVASKRSGRDRETCVRELGPSIKRIALTDSRTNGSGAQHNTLAKPFSLLELATAVRQALDGEDQ